MFRVYSSTKSKLSIHRFFNKKDCFLPDRLVSYKQFSSDQGEVGLGYSEVERIVQSTSHRETLQLSHLDGKDKKKIKAAYLKLVKLVHPDVCEHPRAKEAFARVQAANKMIESPYFPFKQYNYSPPTTHGDDEDEYSGGYGSTSEDSMRQRQGFNTAYTSGRSSRTHTRQGYTSSFADFEAQYRSERSNHDRSREGNSNGGFSISPLHGIGLLAAAFILQLCITFIGASSEQKRIQQINAAENLKQEEEDGTEILNQNDDKGAVLNSGNTNSSSPNKEEKSSTKGGSGLMSYFGSKTNEEISQHQKIAQMRGEEILKSGPLYGLSQPKK